MTLDDPGNIKTLESFLSRYGYVPNKDEGTVSANIVSISGGEQEEPFLMRSLEMFQSMNGLVVTGAYDDLTRALIETPRCGFPDIVPMWSHERARWQKYDLTYAFASFSRQISGTDLRRLFREAFSVWSRVTPLTFSE